MQNIQTQIQIPVTNLQSPITLFHRILACFWVFGMVFLSFGIVNAQTATDRQNRSEVGLMTKPLEVASRWLINKQIKAAFGDIEAQAIIVDDVINNALQAAKYIWEKAWQTAILQAALKLISAIFKIISDFVNKLMDMISSIGNLNAVLAPFASSIVGVARNAYSKVVACADYWARKELQETLPAIDTGVKARECPWLNEEPKSIDELTLGFTNADTTDKIGQVLNTGTANIAANRNIPKPEVEGFIQAGAEADTALSFSKTTSLGGCTTGNWLFDQISGAACYAKYNETIQEQFKKDQVADNIRNRITDNQNKVESAVAGEPLLNGTTNTSSSLTLVPNKALDKILTDTKNKQQLPQVPSFFNPKDIDGKVNYHIMAIDKVNWVEENLKVLNNQSLQKPQPAGGVDEMFSNLTEQFTKMLNDLIANLIESVIFKIVDFIADTLLKAINSFLGPDSILGGLGLDSVAGDLVNTMRNGIKDSVSGAANSISDPLAGSGKATSEAVASFKCDGKIYWKNSSGYELAKLANCQYTDTNFDNANCKQYTSKDEYDALIKSFTQSVLVFANGKEVDVSSRENMQGLIERTCSERNLPRFELKT
jgi:hypothetical protein